MPPACPKIDPRSYDELVRETEALVETLTSERLDPRSAAIVGRVLAEDVPDPRDDSADPIAKAGTAIDAALAGRLQQIADLDPIAVHGWCASRNGGTDAGGALIRIFARMAELVVDRINLAPEKNLLAFLDLVGTRLLPPVPARVPLTFALAEGAQEDAFVPAGTQVAAAPMEGEGEDILFETGRDLVVTAARLIGVFAHDPVADRLADCTARALPASAATFAAFEGDAPVERYVYLSHEELFALAGGGECTLSFAGTGIRGLPRDAVRWSYWNGAKWELFGGVRSTIDRRELLFTLPSFPVVEPRAVDGRTGRWVRAQLEGPAPSPPARAFLVQVKYQATSSGLSADLGYFNDLAVDLTKDFYPFGEAPRFNDTFYLASDEVFSKGGANVTITVAFSAGVAAPNASHAPVLAWEARTGGKWVAMNAQPVSGSPAGVVHLRAAGSLTLPLPAEVEPCKHQGEERHWIRARLVSGSFGTEARYLRVQGEADLQLTSDSLRPPSVASLSLAFTYAKNSPPTAVLTCDEGTYVDRTEEANETGGDFPLFAPPDETRPALYLGFDRAFANRQVTLYAGVEATVYDPAQAEEAAAAADDPARVVWEYESDSGWAPLAAADGSAALTRRGSIRFLGPADFRRGKRFGLDAFWLRARWEGGNYAQPPRLRHLLANTAWAYQCVTASEESLGSSTAEPDQVFHTANAPVLAGERIEVREPDAPPPAEVAVLGAADGSDVVRAVAADEEVEEGFWVRWQRVTDFYGSGPRDRHYVLDPRTGAIRFGDGRHGLIPPEGRDNVRAAAYAFGGGVRGNVPAGSITELKTAVPYIDAVVNHEAARGGDDQEGVEAAKRRGPRALRHRDRAVTVADVEDLAHEATTDVARALAVPPHHDPFDGWSAPHTDADNDAGRVGLILVPRSDADLPAPDMELVRRVRDYVEARSSPTLDLWIAGPHWVRVSVQVWVGPTSLEAAEGLRARVQEFLRNFLHPLRGGPEGRGWDFGRRPHASDLQAHVAAVPGVDFVERLEIEADPKPDGLSPEERERSLVYSGTHAVVVVQPETED